MDTLLKKLSIYMLFSAGLKERKNWSEGSVPAMGIERVQCDYVSLVNVLSLCFACVVIFYDECVNLISVWKQDETFEIGKEKYHGQQYCHIYFARLHLLRTLLYSLAPHWKPNFPGNLLLVFLLSHPLRVI